MNKAYTYDETTLNDTYDVYLGYEKFQDQDSETIERAITLNHERNMTLNLNKSFYFYFCTLIISVLYSLYYCLILSMDEEIELVSSKIFQSIFILAIQSVEAIINDSRKRKKKQIEIRAVENLAKLSLSQIESPTYIIKEASFDNFDMENKEMIFYDVIYGMLSFTSELTIYYFLSVATSFNLNIGMIYSFRCIESLFLVMRFSFFNIKLKNFQLLAVFSTLTSISIIFFFYSPEYNGFMLIGTATTISLFKFIQYCIFEYIHHKTRDAKKLIRHSIYVDGMIGLMLLVCIFVSDKKQWIISDLENLIKVALASLFYYFAMKISVQKESDYKDHRIFSSLNFIFVLFFDYLLNKRYFSIKEFLIVCVIAISQILMFVNENSLRSKHKQEKR